LIIKATPQHVDAMKIMADANRSELGFTLRAQIQEAIEQNRAFVALIDKKLVGFVIYRHRKRDLQTTLAEICISQDYRGRGLGKGLIEALVQECLKMSRAFIQLKCPVDLPANKFYERLGFRNISSESGKSRRLNIWVFQTSQGSGTWTSSYR
jgi:ribosomal protein S18 acetylase RimI-like enzyme